MSRRGSEPFPDEDIALLERFTEVFALAYSRFEDLQMGLMPTESPQIEGFDIAGRCLPANHVGGDFFQYFPQDGRLSICMADVTGHAMEAANAQEEIFGFEQMAETIRAGCAEGLPAETLIDQLIGAVQDFAGDAPQGDDMTVVVLKVDA